MKENKKNEIYILKRNSKYDQFYVRYLRIKHDSNIRTKTNKYFDNKQNEILNDLINRLKQRKINFRLINNNLSGVNVIYDFTGNESRYIPEINKIVLNNYDYKKEEFTGLLLNMASTKVEGNRIYSGLSQTNLLSKKTIGKGLNKGCTLLLTNEYYYINNTETIEKVVNRLSYIVNLEKYYYNANLKGLITELSSYDSVDNIHKFLNYLDIINDLSRKDIDKRQKRAYNKALLKSSLLLTKWYSRKKQNQFNNGQITENEMYNYIDSFINKLNFDELDAIYNNEEVKFPIKYKCQLMEPFLK